MRNMQTEQYINLEKRFDSLKQVFLNDPLSPTGDYEDHVFEKTNAYKVLTHAEIEYYFEQSCLSIAKKAFKNWENTGKSSKCIVALVSYYSGNRLTYPSSLSGSVNFHGVEDYVKDAFTEYSRYVNSENHGIKEKNIYQLCLPIGINIAEISGELLSAASSYGTERGGIAHTTGRIIRRVTPDEAMETTDNILQHIKEFDSMICSINDELDTT